MSSCLVDDQEAVAAASTAGVCAQQADLWRKGLGDWGQSAERIARLRAAAEFVVYTPGSRAGRPVNALGNFMPPPPPSRKTAIFCARAFRARRPPFWPWRGRRRSHRQPRAHSDREHLQRRLVSSQRARSARSGARHPGPSLCARGGHGPRLILSRQGSVSARHAIQQPPGRAWVRGWLEGEPLDIGRLLFTAEGRPRASIFTISHLGDAERMFFVSNLLTEVVAWMRTQPAPPACGRPLYGRDLRLFPAGQQSALQAAAAHAAQTGAGLRLGVVLSTQNPGTSTTRDLPTPAPGLSDACRPRETSSA